MNIIRIRKIRKYRKQNVEEDILKIHLSLSLFFCFLSFYVELTVAPPHGNMELFAAGIQAPCAPLTVV
jgi:hypothetical protein